MPGCAMPLPTISRSINWCAKSSRGRGVPMKSPPPTFTALCGPLLNVPKRSASYFSESDFSVRNVITIPLIAGHRMTITAGETCLVGSITKFLKIDDVIPTINMNSTANRSSFSTNWVWPKTRARISPGPPNFSVTPPFCSLAVIPSTG